MISARKWKKAVRRIFFVFMAKGVRGESQTLTCPSCETPNVSFSFSDNHPAVFFPGARVKTFVFEGAYRRERVQRIPLSAVQFTLVAWPATTSASKRQRPIRGGVPSLTIT